MAYLGPSGTYSHQAATDALAGQPGAHVTFTLVATIGDAVRFLDRPDGGERYCVVPIENSIYGPVKEALEALGLPAVPPSRRPSSSSSGPWTWDGEDCILPDTCPSVSVPPMRIVGHVRLSIAHALLVSEAAWGTHGDAVLDHVDVVESHEQALGQCQAYLSSHLPLAKRIPVASTALAASRVRQVEGLAAIASPFAARLYGAHVFARGVQDEKGNVHPPLPCLSNSTDPHLGSSQLDALCRLDSGEGPSLSSAPRSLSRSALSYPALSYPSKHAVHQSAPFRGQQPEADVRVRRKLLVQGGMKIK